MRGESYRKIYFEEPRDAVIKSKSETAVWFGAISSDDPFVRWRCYKWLVVVGWLVRSEGCADDLEGL